MSHPLFQTYANTLQQTFPLVLIIGREPNTDLEISGEHGLYNFDDHPRCAFWNVAYSVVAETQGLSAAQLKQQCRHRRSSPLVFADALPIGIKYAVRRKDELRELAREKAPITLRACLPLNR